MRKKDVTVLIIVAGITAVLSVFVALASKKAENVTGVNNTAYEEITSSMEIHQLLINDMMSGKLSALESLAYHMAIMDEPDFPSEHEFSNAVMLANSFGGIYYSDLMGNTVAYDGVVKGNISGQKLFSSPSVWRGVPTVQYSDSYGFDGKPVILFAVPVRCKNVLTGILFAESEPTEFDGKLLADNFNGGESVFVTDSSGNIILRNSNALNKSKDANLFSGYLSNSEIKNSTEKILIDMRNGKAGCFSYSHGIKEYIGYSPLGISDWYVFCMASEKSLSEKYALHSDSFRKAIGTLTGSFYILSICASLVVVYFVRHYYLVGKKLKRKDLILEANDAFMYSDSAQPIVQLRSSRIAEQMAEHAYGTGSVITSILSEGKVKLYFVSIGILESLGYSEDELSDICENDVSKLIHPDDLREVAEINTENTDIGDSFRLTVRYRKKNGEYMWVDEYSHIFRLDDGTAVCASQFVDITKQKELEQQLIEREEEYRIATSIGKYVVMRYDVKRGSMTVLSRGATSIALDSFLDDVPAKAIRMGIVAPESADTVRKVFSDIASGRSREGKAVFALDTGSGVRKWVEMSYSAVEGAAEGTPSAAILSFSDITERRRAEDFINIGSAFPDYSADAKLIIANLSSGLIEYEAPGTAHRSFTGITGTGDIYKILQYALKHAVVSEYAGAFSEFLSIGRLIKEFEAGNLEEGFDCPIIGENGVEKWVNLQLRLARDSYSEDVKAYLILKDIDAQKHLEQELQNSKSELTGDESCDSNATQEDPKPLNRQLFARTFGYFDFFIDGKPLHFTNRKEKELLALLIDRNGGTLSAEEAVSILWEDEPFGEKQLTRYRKLASRLKSTLAEAGCDDIIITSHGIRHIDVSKIECDYYEVLNSNSRFIKLYQGIYMLNYSWAEETTAALNRLLLFSEEE